MTGKPTARGDNRQSHSCSTRRQARVLLELLRRDANRNPPSPEGLSVVRLRFEDRKAAMHSIIYLVGLIVIVLFILSFFGLA